MLRLQLHLLLDIVLACGWLLAFQLLELHLQHLLVVLCLPKLPRVPLTLKMLVGQIPIIWYLHVL
jgi:hypothetical protein